MKKLLTLLFCLTLVMLALAACGGDAAPAGEPASTPASTPENTYATSLDDIKANGELIIGLDDTFAPMGFRDTDGTLVGFDIDLATAVCEKLGVTATFQPISWDAKEMELNTGNIDCIWNGMSATPERQESMSLSQDYLNNRIIVMTGEGITIASKEDLVNFNVGTQGGSAALEVVQADPIYDALVEADKIHEYPDYDEALLALGSGREDCIIIDEVFGNYKNAQIDNKYGVADFDFGDDLYAIGFRKSDTELTGAVNAALNELIADGTAAEISTAWFGQDIVVKP